MVDKIEDLYEDIMDLELEISSRKEYKDFTDDDFLEEAEDIVDRYIEEEAEILADDVTYYDEDYLVQTLEQKRREYMGEQKKNIEYKKERLNKIPKLEQQIKNKVSELREELNLPKDIQEPKMYIYETTVPELESDTTIDFVKGNRLIQELNERYSNAESQHHTKYNVIIPDDSPQTVFIHESETFDFGNDHYISPYHQIKESGNLKADYVKSLDNAIMRNYKDKDNETQKFVEDTLNKSQSKNKTLVKEMDV